MTGNTWMVPEGTGPLFLTSREAGWLLFCGNQLWETATEGASFTRSTEWTDPISNMIRLSDGCLMTVIWKPEPGEEQGGCYAVYSADDGKTFDDPIELFRGVLNPAGMNDRLLRLCTGRILWPVALSAGVPTAQDGTGSVCACLFQ